MKRSLGPTPLLAPVPVVLVGASGEASLNATTTELTNAMTAAWVGVINSKPPMVSLAVRHTRLTWSLLRTSGEFTLNVARADQADIVDYCGVVSRRDVDKIAVCRLQPIAIDGLAHAPGFDVCPLILACRITSCHSLGSHDLFFANIINVVADDDWFDGDAFVLNRAPLLSYGHGTYFACGQPCGFFGFSLASRSVLATRLDRAHWPRHIHSRSTPRRSQTTSPIKKGDTT